MKRIAVALSMAMLWTSDASAQLHSIPALNKNKTVNEYTIYLLSYGSVARACGHEKYYYAIKTTLVDFIELQMSKGGLTSEGRKLYGNVNAYLEKGANEFRRRPYVTCGEATQFYVPIIDAVSALMRANR